MPDRPIPEVSISAHSPDGIGEIRPGDDLAGVLAGLPLRDGDIVVVTSKVVAKAEGRIVRGEREQVISDETVRVVARRGSTRIVENHLGLVMAAAGVDASNTDPGTLVLLPVDPDATARRLRVELAERVGIDVAIIVSDTAGRAWRQGQTDIAIGVAGLMPLDSFAGRTDRYGNELAVTAPAVADEIAGLAELTSGKLGQRPVTLVRGMADRLLPPGEHGPGARVLIRGREGDMFGLGAREAVVAALARTDRNIFGAPAAVADLLAAVTTIGATAEEGPGGSVEVTGAVDPLGIDLLAHAFGWTRHPDEPDRLVPAT